MNSPSTNGQGAKPFRDDQCMAIMALPGYSLTDCSILLWIAKHEYFGQTTCSALPSTIAADLGGKVGIRTIQVRLRAFEDAGLIRCLKSTRGVFAIRETSLTAKFWTLVQAELAKLNPKRYGDSNHASAKRNPLRLEADSQAQSSAPQAQPIALAPISQAQPIALAPMLQAQSNSFEPTMIEPARVPANSETANTESSVVNSRGDDDDVRPNLKEKTQGIDDVCDVIRRCKHLPNEWMDKIRESTSLGRRIKDDWDSLMLAAMRLDGKIRDKDVKVKKIDNPVNYLIGVVREINGEDFPPGEREGLREKVQRVQDTTYPGAYQHGERVPAPAPAPRPASPEEMAMNEAGTAEFFQRFHKPESLPDHLRKGGFA